LHKYSAFIKRRLTFLEDQYKGKVGQGGKLEGIRREADDFRFIDVFSEHQGQGREGKKIGGRFMVDKFTQGIVH
jgi:hypothetical protein